ncbi:hypothetical protein PABY_10970 [Pyrodictium abyssi]|uniref:Uncharacterized protein n=1 Tax=Pyrodictium abyssi TaxID=54256 RepID=A0ABM8IZD8_9CREN|nr:hypothetical protein PABY_10970 [Pyrodictium abyssi]
MAPGARRSRADGPRALPRAPLPAPASPLQLYTQSPRAYTATPAIAHGKRYICTLSALEGPRLLVEGRGWCGREACRWRRCWH